MLGNYGTHTHTHTHTFAFPRQERFRERTAMLRYAHNVCLAQTVEDVRFMKELWHELASYFQL